MGMTSARPLCGSLISYPARSFSSKLADVRTTRLAGNGLSGILQFDPVRLEYPDPVDGEHPGSRPSRPFVIRVRSSSPQVSTGGSEEKQNNKTFVRSQNW